MSASARILTVLERIAVALERQSLPVDVSETVNVKEAAALLKTTPRAIYVRHQRGQMPKPLPGAKRLLWRKSDLLGAKR